MNERHPILFDSNVRETVKKKKQKFTLDVSSKCVSSWGALTYRGSKSFLKLRGSKHKRTDCLTEPDKNSFLSVVEVIYR